MRKVIVMESAEATETIEKKYVYAEKEQQIVRTNKMIVTGNAVFYFIILILVWISTYRGIRSIGYAGAITGIILVITINALVFYLKKPESPVIKYSSFIGIMMVTAMLCFSYNNYYMRFMAALPLVSCVITFDKKYTAIATGTFAVLNVVITIIRVSVMKAYTGEAVLDQYCANLAIIILMYLIFRCTCLAEKFNHDTRHSLMRQQEKQEKIMYDVLDVAEKVRNGTENAMTMVNDLNSSTEMVKSAMQDISDSTMNTAENIQTQTTMTQQIQESIDTTINRSENMVRVAKESEEINEQSIEIMNDLKKQSEVIGSTNSEVAQSMKKLQERTNAVKSIADTIFSISSQTNLLALNASIESARAGEAGRGFAVVADEIRQLAEKTRQETESIAAILNELSEDATAASEAVSRSVNAADAQDGMISKASDSFGSMSDNVTKLIADIGEIDSMLNSLSQANNQIVENIMNLSATTEEVTASSVQAADLSASNLENSENTRQLLGDILNTSHQLDQFFKK